MAVRGAFTSAMSSSDGASLGVRSGNTAFWLCDGCTALLHPGLGETLPFANLVCGDGRNHHEIRGTRERKRTDQLPADNAHENEEVTCRTGQVCRLYAHSQGET